MEYVPLDKKISIGDSVVTSGLEENIRWGILIGQIVEINKKDNSIFQELTIKPLLNPNFKIVSIILPVKTE
jgi:rod shape-determining protein MreC